VKCTVMVPAAVSDSRFVGHVTHMCGTVPLTVGHVTGLIVTFVGGYRTQTLGAAGQVDVMPSDDIWTVVLVVTSGRSPTGCVLMSSVRWCQVQAHTASQAKTDVQQQCCCCCCCCCC
jgi:hypothetical protein